MKCRSLFVIGLITFLRIFMKEVTSLDEIESEIMDSIDLGSFLMS